MSKNNGYIDRENLFANPAKRRFSDTEIEGFGKVRLRSLTAREKTRYDSRAIDSKGRVKTSALLTANARLIVLVVVDSEGQPVFSDGDVEKLLDMDSGVIEQLASDCGKHCGIADEEESAKN